MSTKKSTVLVADDHPLMLKGICAELEKIPSLDIIRTVQNGAEALHYIDKDKPDIALLDLDMPLMSGLEVIKAAKQSGSTTKFIVLTFHKEPAILRRVLDLDVMGYLLKDNSSVEITECLEHVRHGKKYISQGIEEAQKAGKPDRVELLTDTELKVVRLIGKGLSSQSIADLMFVSGKTIENHRSNICHKLNLDGKHNSLVKWAMQHKDNI